LNALYLIPARGGSKSILNKNIKELNGKRLIYYTIDAAREIAIDEDICVSTDSDQIINAVENYGLQVPFVRPEELATDNATTAQVVKHAYDFFLNQGKRYDVIVILQPTSPFRNGTHIKEALDLFKFDLDLVVSVYQTNANPYYVLYESDDNGFLKKSKAGNFYRRQDCPKVYQLNGAIYVLNCSSIEKYGQGDLGKIIGYEMEESSSIDLDSELDWEFAEYILKKGIT
jgi:N-acylneuraminate cytidylyltransferase